MITAAAAALPFAIAGYVGILGVGLINDDMASHLIIANYIGDYSGHVPSFIKGGYPIGPHAVVAGISRLTGAGLVDVFAGLHDRARTPDRPARRRPAREDVAAPADRRRLADRAAVSRRGLPLPGRVQGAAAGHAPDRLRALTRGARRPALAALRVGSRRRRPTPPAPQHGPPDQARPAARGPRRGERLQLQPARPALGRRGRRRGAAGPLTCSSSRAPSSPRTGSARSRRT